MSVRNEGYMKWKYSSAEKMAGIFLDSNLMPRYLIKNYYLLVFDLLASEKNIPNNSIIFKELQHCILKLNPKEIEYLNLRYGLKHGKLYTLENIGNIYGFTKEWARQCIDKALTKLRADKSMFVIKYKLQALKLQKADIEKKIAYYESILTPDTNTEIKLEDIGLTNRAYNALIRIGITTYEELSCLSPYEIFTIKNVGKKTAKEIWYKVHNEELHVIK